MSQTDSDIETQQLEKANQALDSLNSAAGTARSLFAAFLLLTAYLAISFINVTDLQLLRYSPINLPIINVGVDMKSFYTFVPWLYMIMHANMLLVFSLITDKINLLEQAIQPLSHPQRISFRKRIHLLIFAQYLSKQHAGFFKLVLNLIVWLSVGLFPLLLLLSAQLAFLPAQEEGVLWLQRLCIVIDAGLICYFWNTILQKHRMALLSKEWKLPQWRKRNNSAQALYFISFIAVYFSIFIATAPCSWWDTTIGKCAYTGPDYQTQAAINKTRSVLGMPADTSLISWIKDGKPNIYDTWHNKYNPIVSTSYYIFDNPQTRLYRRHIVINNEVITNNQLEPETINNIRDGNPVNIEKTTLNKIIGINLDNRQLKFADFSSSYLPKASLQQANLYKAKFLVSNMQQANFDWANLEKSNFRKANLETASFIGTKLQKACFIGANLEKIKKPGWVKLDNVLCQQ